MVLDFFSFASPLFVLLLSTDLEVTSFRFVFSNLDYITSNC